MHDRNVAAETRHVTLRGPFGEIVEPRSMTQQTPAEQELAKLIVENLNLENIKPADIDPEAPLFGGDLGLDSIDALELALAVSKRYGIQLRSDNPDNRRVFGSLRALAQHIEANAAA